MPGWKTLRLGEPLPTGENIGHRGAYLVAAGGVRLASTTSISIERSLEWAALTKANTAMVLRQQTIELATLEPRADRS